MNNFSDKYVHINSEDIKKFKIGVMLDDDLTLFAEHISDCEECALLLADSYDSSELIAPPQGFSEVVKEEISINRIYEFYKYSLRVSVAACVALFILFTGVFRIGYTVDIKAPNMTFLDTVNKNIVSFSDNLIKMEVMFYGKEK